LGGYVVADWPEKVAGPRVILIGTGSEVSIALAARDQLAEQDLAARVVSLPSWELFSAQSPAYRARVLPPSVKARVSIEAGVTYGWERWIGEQGIALGLDRFGASAPFQTVYQQLGLTAERVVAAALEVIR